MLNLIRRTNLGEKSAAEAGEPSRREWLVTNGRGGYASGTVSGIVSRRYHGILIAALPAPFGRVVMLNHLAEYLQLPDGKLIQFGGEDPASSGESGVVEHCLSEFRLENGLPVWTYEWDRIALEKRLLLIYDQNTTCLRYELKSGQQNVSLCVRPSIHFRRHDQPVSEPLPQDFNLSITGHRCEISCAGWDPVLRLSFSCGACAITQGADSNREYFYSHESERGYESRGKLWTPGTFSMELNAGHPVYMLASTEEWPRMLALSPERAMECERGRRARLIAQAAPPAREGVGAELVLAADQFVITPRGRTAESVRARAAGDHVRTVIAGYHWFTDWGRDSMISLEGLTLTTGRHAEAGWILRTFADYIRDGLIPNLFPEETDEGLYHTADATLWFFHALSRYLEVTGDRLTLKLMLPKLMDIVEWHQRGTRFGIRVDPEDGLLCQGAEGYQLTWMDAKAGDWVVTPRRGKTVEINALWYNALKLLEKWLSEERGAKDGVEIGRCAQKAFSSFNRKFWYPEGGYLLDVVEGENGNDAAFRPNQLLAISLQHPVLESRHWPEVLEKVTQRLLTPVGLRTLSPDHPDYKPKYFGDLRARDAAYHQGTVWAWLMGPYIDALLKTHPEKKGEARQMLQQMMYHLDEACIGSISEIFDAEAPFTPRGCIAQAWSVAEILRCWVKVLS